jgi:hypothetical protein
MAIFFSFLTSCAGFIEAHKREEERKMKEYVSMSKDFPIKILKGEFFLSLIKVEKNGKEMKNSDINKRSLTFEDDMIKISWTVPHKEFNFSLFNKTEDTLKVIWDDMVFVDCEGRSSKTAHYGVSYINANNFQPASVLIKHSILRDAIIPTDNINYCVIGDWQGWSIEAILRSSSDNMTGGEVDDANNNRPAVFRKIGEETIGKTLVVYFPILIKSQTIEYVFTFKVDDFKFDGQVLGGF